MCDFINDYSYIKTLGSGFSGDVILVKHKKTKKLYTIKRIILKEFNEDNNIDIYKNSEKIVKLLMKKKNPNVAKLYKSKLCKCNVLKPLKILIQVKEYYKITLYDYVINNKPNKTWWYKFIQEYLKAIDLLTKEKISHNDLQPHNILFNNPEDCIPIFNDWDMATINKPIHRNNYLFEIISGKYNNIYEYLQFHNSIPKEIIEFSKSFIKI